MLYLVVQSGAARFAIEAVQVAEVLPLIAIEPWAGRAPAVGLIRYADAAVPVIDLGQALGLRGTPAPPRLSHRLVLVRHPRDPDRLLALRVEKAAETLRTTAAGFKPAPDGWEPQAPVTGALLDGNGMILALDLARLLQPFTPATTDVNPTSLWTPATSKSY